MEQSLFPHNPILLVDDEIDSLRSFKMTLMSAGINNILLCQDAREVITLISNNKIEVILLDLIMPFISGEELLSMIIENYPEIPVIIITALSEVNMAVQCMKAGSFDYMVKPIETNRLISGVKNAIEVRTLQNENKLLKEHILSGSLKHPKAFSHFITQNRSMLGLFQYAESISKSSRTVLITGETGVGKELMVKSIHTLSERKGPLLTANVAGIDNNIFSDTLFGHMEGAFTGAGNTRKGLIEKAFGGTLFLDEIGDLMLESQVKLLRLLQEREYFPLGADLPKIANVKIIVATNLDMMALQASKKFRKDLYYRLCSHHLHMPPLRERLNDVPLLVNHFLKMAAREFGKKTPSPPCELIQLLSNYTFPGNVRELKSMIFDAVANHTSKILSMERIESYLKKQPTNVRDSTKISPETPDSCPSDYELIPTLDQMTWDLMKKAMKKSGNNQSMAARFMGISRQRFGRYLKKFSEQN